MTRRAPSKRLARLDVRVEEHELAAVREHALALERSRAAKGIPGPRVTIGEAVRVLLDLGMFRARELATDRRIVRQPSARVRRVGPRRP